MYTFYKVGARGRVQLEDIATEGDYYTVEKDEDGVIVLTPVEVKTTGGKRATTDPDA